MPGIEFFSAPPSGDRMYTFVTITDANGVATEYITGCAEVSRATILCVCAFARHFGFTSFIDRVTNRGSVPVSLYPVDLDAKGYVDAMVTRPALLAAIADVPIQVPVGVQLCQHCQAPLNTIGNCTHRGCRRL